MCQWCWLPPPCHLHWWCSHHHPPPEVTQLQTPPIYVVNDNNDHCWSCSHFPPIYINDNNNHHQSCSHHPLSMTMTMITIFVNHTATTLPSTMMTTSSITWPPPSHLCWQHDHYMDDNDDNLHWSCSHHHHTPICIDVWPTTMTLMTTTNVHHLHLHGHHQPQPPPPVWWLCCYQCWQWQHHLYLLSYLVTWYLYLVHQHNIFYGELQAFIEVSTC